MINNLQEHLVIKPNTSNIQLINITNKIDFEPLEVSPNLNFLKIPLQNNVFKFDFQIYVPIQYKN